VSARRVGRPFDVPVAVLRLDVPLPALSFKLVEIEQERRRGRRSETRDHGDEGVGCVLAVVFLDPTVDRDEPRVVKVAGLGSTPRVELRALTHADALL